MLEEGVHHLTPSSPALAIVIDAIVQIHASCILDDNMMATFIPPLCHREMTDDWTKLIDETVDKGRHVLVYVSGVATRSSGQRVQPPFEKHAWPLLPGDSSSQRPGLEISGVVSLSCPTSQTGPFRGLVQRPFVSPFHRRKGIATCLMAELEKNALGAGRWNLMLDTPVGSVAEQMYPKLGWETLGVIRQYGINPSDGKMLLDEVFFWKDLRESR